MQILIILIICSLLAYVAAIIIISFFDYSLLNFLNIKLKVKFNIYEYLMIQFFGIMLFFIFAKPVLDSVDQIKVSDLLLVNHDGHVVQGDRSVNIAAFTIHSRLHMARPDVNAAAHSHSMYGKTFATLGKFLDPISQDSCAFYERQAIYDDFSGVSEDTTEGERIAQALGDKQVLIMQNHGVLSTGSSLDIALWYFFSLERCCQSQLMAEAAGKPTLIPHETAVKTRDFIANELAAWASFQPLYDMITQKEPDLFE